MTIILIDKSDNIDDTLQTLLKTLLHTTSMKKWLLGSYNSNLRAGAPNYYFLIFPENCMKMNKLDPESGWVVSSLASPLISLGCASVLCLFNSLENYGIQKKINEWNGGINAVQPFPFVNDEYIFLDTFASIY